MIFINRIIFILSFVHFIFIGFGGLQCFAENRIEDTIIQSSSQLTFNSDQVYSLGSKDHHVSEFILSELLESEEDNKSSKLIFNPLLTAILVKKQFKNTKSDSPKLLISSNLDRYIILQTFRL